MKAKVSMTWPTLPTRERDALVAEKVMGYRWIKDICSRPKFWLFSPDDFRDYNPDYIFALETLPKGAPKEIAERRVPPFSTSIADAFKVVEQFEFMDINKEGEEYSVTINQDWSISGPEAGFGRTDFARSKSLPEALSLAALRAKGVEV